MRRRRPSKGNVERGRGGVDGGAPGQSPGGGGAAARQPGSQLWAPTNSNARSRSRSVSRETRGRQSTTSVAGRQRMHPTGYFCARRRDAGGRGRSVSPRHRHHRLPPSTTRLTLATAGGWDPGRPSWPLSAARRGAGHRAVIDVRRHSNKTLWLCSCAFVQSVIHRSALKRGRQFAADCRLTDDDDITCPASTTTNTAAVSAASIHCISFH